MRARIEDLVYERREHASTHTSTGGLVLLDTKRGIYFSLENVGLRIWELVDGKLTVRDIADVICREYDAPFEDILFDVIELFHDLLDRGLLSPVESR